jgi:hypothetical protein
LVEFKENLIFGINKRVKEMKKSDIIIVKEENISYPNAKYFRPSICYPEYPFKEDIESEKNYIYDMIRETKSCNGY